MSEWNYFLLHAVSDDDDDGDESATIWTNNREKLNLYTF